MNKGVQTCVQSCSFSFLEAQKDRLDSQEAQDFPLCSVPPSSLTRAPPLPGPPACSTRRPSQAHPPSHLLVICFSHLLQGAPRPEWFRPPPPEAHRQQDQGHGSWGPQPGAGNHLSLLYRQPRGGSCSGPSGEAWGAERRAHMWLLHIAATGLGTRQTPYTSTELWGGGRRAKWTDVY